MGDFAGASARALMSASRKDRSEARLALTFGCKDVYANASMELSCIVSRPSFALKISESSSGLEIAGWILCSSCPGVVVEGTAFKPNVSQNLSIIDL